MPTPTMLLVSRDEPFTSAVKAASKLLGNLPLRAFPGLAEASPPESWKGSPLVLVHWPEGSENEELVAFLEAARRSGSGAKVLVLSDQFRADDARTLIR